MQMKVNFIKTVRRSCIYLFNEVVIYVTFYYSSALFFKFICRFKTYLQI
uniref:Uncharacterized protein n=1 Tax=Ciona intestinalis TaxID=7719 RepID=H2Y3A2_CIOIN